MAKKNNEAKITFTAATGEFNKAIKESNDEMSKLRAEMRLNAEQMKTTGETAEGLEKKHQNLSDQLAISQDKTEALSQKLDKAKEIFGDNSEEAKKLETQLINARIAEEKIKQSIQQCEAAMSNHTAETQDNRNALEKLTDEIEEQQSELDTLKEKYQAAVLEYGAGSREARELAREIKTLSGELSDNKTHLENVSQRANNLDEAFDKADDGADRLCEGFTVLKGAMAELAAEGISKVLDGLKNVASASFGTVNDIDSATNAFIAKTGASTESANEFEESMIDIYNGNYGESFEDIADSMATVKTTLGDIGTDELEGVTQKALILRDTFDFDVNESVRAANSMMDKFGITADEAYNLIAQGAQKGLNQNGDLLDVINEYSMQFSTAGYSAEDMFNMLANGVESGTWSVDKLGDAVKEFNIRMSDGSAKEAVEALGFSWEKVSEDWSKGGDSAKEVFNIMFNELDGLENTTEGYSIGVGLLGTMYEDLGQESVLALSKTEGEISATKNALDEINSVKYDDLGSAFEGIKRNLQTAVAEPMKNEVMPVINDFIKGADWQTIGQTIGDAFSKVVKGAFAIAEGVKSAVKWMSEHKELMTAIAIVVGVLTTAITAYNVVQGIKTAMDAANVTTVWALVSAHIAQAAAAAAAIAPYILIVAAIAAVIAIVVLLIKNWDKVKEVTIAVWNAIKSAISTAWNAIKNAVSTGINFVKNLMSTVMNAISTAFQAAWNGIKSFFESIWNGIKSFFTTVTNTLKNAASAAWNAIKSGVETYFNVIKTVYETVWNGIKNFFTSTVNGIKNTASNVFNAIKNTITSIWNGVKNTTTSVWNGIKSGVSNVVNGIRNTVSSVFNGIKNTAVSVWNGIKNAIINPVETAKSTVSGIVDKIKGVFNFKWKLPELKLPHVSVSGGKAPFGIAGKGSLPKFSVEWYKEGGIMTKPTLFGMNGSNFMGGGEAGAEAILPIEKLEGYIANAVEKTVSVVNFQSLADAIIELASRPVEVGINGRKLMQVTASDSDRVNGMRSTFIERGLVLD